MASVVKCSQDVTAAYTLQAKNDIMYLTINTATVGVLLIF